MPRVTVAQAVVLTGRSKSAIYRLIATDRVRPIESTEGLLVDLDQVRRAIADVKRGRPRGTSKHAA
jgi:hypothetical protein